MTKQFFSLLFLVFMAGACQTSNEKEKSFNPEYPFLDYRLSLDERVNDLVSRLSLEEKIGQMMYDAPAIERLGIPAYNWWSECLHGVARNGKATVFPQAIGLAATFDDVLLADIAGAIADEARAKFDISFKMGNHQRYTGLTFWTPNVNIFRDPRWGRGQETYGEDPYLTATMGTAFVKALQGDDPNYLKAAACAKHFVVHSGPEKDRHVFDAVASKYDMADTYLPAFKALADAGVEGFMCAYNRTNGEACCGSHELLTSLLRDEWGFEGYITSDCWALIDIYQNHKLVATPEEAAALALKSGVNLNCGDLYDEYLPEAVKKGLVTEAEIDASLKILLKTRFRLGLFDPEDRSPFKNIDESVINSPEHRALALKAAQKSVVLLKNDGALPLDRNIRSIYAVGPNAGNVDVLLGNYYGASGEMSTLLEGLVNRANPGTTVEYKMGFLLERTNVNPIDWTTGEAHKSDAVILFAGISPMLEGEEGESILSPTMGDRYDYGLPDNQVDYIKLIAGKGDKPVILVLTGGSPVDVSEVEPYVDAILYVWYPGEEGGNGLADVLFGNVNPSGRLPVTFPKSLEQLPPYDDYNMKGRTYRYMETDPYYPFGFGLSYTKFEYSSASAVAEPGSNKVKVNVKVKNQGEYEGEEVVQLYIGYPQEISYAPVCALKGFSRIMLKPGEEKEVVFELDRTDFALSNLEGQLVVNPGKYRINIGGASPLKRSNELGMAWSECSLSL